MITVSYLGCDSKVDDLIEDEMLSHRLELGGVIEAELSHTLEFYGTPADEDGFMSNPLNQAMIGMNTGMELIFNCLNG